MCLNTALYLRAILCAKCKLHVVIDGYFYQPSTLIIMILYYGSNFQDTLSCFFSLT